MEPNPKVLLVDEETAARRRLGSDLKARGFATESCSHGLTALRRLAASESEGRSFDYVVLAAHLPDMDGIKLLRIIKAAYGGLPVVVMAGRARLGLDEEVRKSGGRAFLLKPVDADKLLGAFQGEEDVTIPVASAEPSSDEAKALAFVHLEEGADPVRVLTDLQLKDGVAGCDAVRGSCEIVVRLQGTSPATLDAFVRDDLGGVDGVARVEAFHFTRPKIDPAMARFIAAYEGHFGAPDTSDPMSAESYALLEIGPAFLGELYPRLYWLDETVELGVERAGNQLIVRLRAPDFGRIRDTLNNTIRYMDGILRIDELMVVNMFDLETPPQGASA